MCEKGVKAHVCERVQSRSRNCSIFSPPRRVFRRDRRNAIGEGEGRDKRSAAAIATYITKLFTINNPLSRVARPINVPGPLTASPRIYA